jgi:hypothetical protein
MRIQRAVSVIGILLVLAFFVTGIANAAPDMSLWEGKWFSFQLTKKGILFDGSKFIKGSEKQSGYFKIESWNGTEEKFEITIYSQNDGEWEAVDQYMNFFAGNNLSFLFWYQDEDQQFVAQMVGKEKGGIISSATVTTYGGLVLEVDGNQRAVGSAVLTAKMIDESKVKAPH